MNPSLNNPKIKALLSKKNKSKITCLTCYSKNIAEELDKYIDIVLVGDSLGSVLYNHKTTRKVKLTNMIDHSKSVRHGVKKSLMVVDMPYNTYKSKSQALKNAKKIVKECKCDALKLEGAFKIKSIVKHLIKNKIPIMGHLGILPQTTKNNFKIKGKTIVEKRKLLKEAKMLEKFGVFAIVLECVTSSAAKLLTREIKVPTIGIGSSRYCDGQVLVTDDLLGLNETNFRFVKKYGNIRKEINKAVKRFKDDVLKEKFPTKKYSY